MIFTMYADFAKELMEQDDSVITTILKNHIKMVLKNE